MKTQAAPRKLIERVALVRHCRFPVFVFLFALFIPYSIYANNRGEIRASEFVTVLVIVATTNLFLLAVAKVLRLKIQAIAIVLSVFWVFFFNYRALGTLSQTYGLQLRYSVPFILVSLLLLATVLQRLEEKRLRPLSQVFFFTSILMFVYPTVLVLEDVSAEVKSHFGKPAANIKTATDIVDFPRADSDDVFYIILDGYGGNEVLNKYMQLDNSDFYRYLEDSGFVISYNSRSNYTTTPHSMACSLNMVYLDKLVSEYGEGSTNLDPIMQSIFTSSVLGFMKSQGYETVMITGSTHLSPKAETGLLDTYEGYVYAGQYLIAVFANTPLVHLGSSGRGLFCELTADGKPWVPHSIDWVLNRCLLYSKNGRRDFVLAHILCPHSPYYFDEQGNIAVTRKEEHWNDFSGRFEEYRDGYSSNLLGLNKKIERFLDSLLREKYDPIVLIQGDHGPPEILDGVLKNHGIDRCTFRTSILSAFLLPDACRSFISDGITPVNSFRIVLAHLKAEAPILLDNRSYASSYRKPFQFVRLECDQK